MKEPSTTSDIQQFHELLQSDPKKAAEAASRWIRSDPNNDGALFRRHMAWLELGDSRRALEDISRAIKIRPSPAKLLARGQIHMRLGDYAKAIEDYAQGERIDPEQWGRDAIPCLYQADAYARSGNEPMALACCAKLPEAFWSPGPNATPPGDKMEIAEELKRRAAAARRRRT